MSCISRQYNINMERDELKDHLLEILELRKQGYSLDAIGEQCGHKSRQAVSLVLLKYVGHVQISERVTRQEFARRVGHSMNMLVKLEKAGEVSVYQRGSRYFYNPQDVDTIKKLLDEMAAPVKKVELTCIVCGRKFYRRPSGIRKGSPGLYCSNRCRGHDMGLKYGFGVHRKFGHRKRKWNYEEVWKLRDETHWSCSRIARWLKMPMGSVYIIVRAQPGYIPGKRGVGGGVRKWNYDDVYALQDKTGQGAWLIGRELNIPKATVSYILAKRKLEIQAS